MECPRCGAVAGDGLECPRCGVVLAKARAAAARKAAPPEPKTPSASLAIEEPEGGSGSRRLSTLAMLALCALAVLLAIRTFRTEPGRAPATVARPIASGSGPSAVDRHDGAVDVAPPAFAIAAARLSVDPARLPAAASEQDRLDAEGISGRLRGHAMVDDTDVVKAERLFSRYPENTRGLLEATLVGAARQHRSARRYDDAGRLLDRAAALNATSDLIPREVLALRMDQLDWVAVERAANDVLRKWPTDVEAIQALAYALVRQDRSREAREILEAYLADHDHAGVKALLAKIRHDDRSERGLQQQTLAHFNVRYDGEAHEDVGREVLGVLERHYATLATTFEHQPAESIPVILLSRQAYYGSGDVPTWAGGHYSGFDGRVRIPIGGLTTSLTPRLDGTVLHELTHAFVADLSKGQAPTELQEGLAQWMEGDRTDDRAMKLLIAGHLDGVSAKYLGALAFVEGLMAERGQGGINEALAEMGRTRTDSEAFRSVYGLGYREALAAARDRWRQRYGS